MKSRKHSFKNNFIIEDKKHYMNRSKDRKMEKYRRRFRILQRR